MTGKGYALAREELVRALTAYTGVATNDGAADGTTLVDSALIDRNDFVTEKTIIIMSGEAQYEDRGAVSFDNTTGVITVVSAFKDSTGVATPIKAGTLYRILNISSVEIDVANIKTVVDAILADTGTTLPAALVTIIAYVDELETRLSAARADLLDQITAARMAELDAANIPADTDPKVMGRTQIFEKAITSPADAGDVIVATITDQPCQIESVIIHADAAQTGDMTSCGVFGGAGKVITFISAADAVQANLDAEDKQVAWTGAVRLAATKTIVISLVGAGATAVDLTIVVKYRACASGGYLA